MDNTLIQKINEILKTRKNCTVNIINDKLTLAVFSMLRKNLKHVSKINFIIRDPRTLSVQGEVTREFELSPNDTLFNAYDIMEKNKLRHFEQARTMFDFIVLVLTPAKLYDNWNSFKGAYKDSILDETFYYKIMFHTDLSRYKGESRSGWDLSRFDWGKFDLVVIDESHNFRNRTEKEIGQTRYQRLLNEVIKQNRNTKVLLLSATPVNNSLNDLRNQISIITADKDDAFEASGISSIANLLRQTSQQLNLWEKESDGQRDKTTLLNRLPGDFYRLLELMTISRSRKHITSFYGTRDVGKFPHRLKPDTHTPHIDVKKLLLNFKDTNLRLEELILAVYMPMSYIKPEYRSMYRERFQTRYNNKVIFSHEDREFITAKMHRFNLFKRLDSSVFAFGETIRRLKERIENEYLRLEKRVKSKMVSANISASGNEDVLSPEMNDISFRTRQLEKLKDEVIDIDDARDNISLTDLNMNEYLFELAQYLKKVPDINTIPRGIYSVTRGEDVPGVIFCFKHLDDAAKPDNDSTLYPYYLIFMDKEGTVRYGNTQARNLLKQFRKLCYGMDQPIKPLVEHFLAETKNAQDMHFYSHLLTRAVRAIQNEEDQASEQGVFDFSGFNNPFAGTTLDDFELISFLVVK